MKRLFFHAHQSLYFKTLILRISLGSAVPFQQTDCVLRSIPALSSTPRILRYYKILLPDSNTMKLLVKILTFRFEIRCVIRVSTNRRLSPTTSAFESETWDCWEVSPPRPRPFSVFVCTFRRRRKLHVKRESCFINPYRDYSAYLRKIKHFYIVGLVGSQWRQRNVQN